MHLCMSLCVKMSVHVCALLENIPSPYQHANMHQPSVAVQSSTAASSVSALAERQKKSPFWTTFYAHAPRKRESVVQELQRGVCVPL